MTQIGAIPASFDLGEKGWRDILGSLPGEARDTGYTELKVGTNPLPGNVTQWLIELLAGQMRSMQTDLETHEERIAMLEAQTQSTDDTEVMLYRPIEVGVSPPTGLSRILARQSDIRRRALEIQQEHGDPIQNLAEMLGNIPGSQEDWDVLIDEPY
jgi:hypothetical protein